MMDLELGRVVLVGDEGAGKTSLAHALAGAALPDVLPRAVGPLPAPVSVRAEALVRTCPPLPSSATSSMTPAPPGPAGPPPAHLTIVDTTPENAAEALRDAAVVCVVCDAGAPRGPVLAALDARWLPLAASMAPHAPVLVVFAQMDRAEGQAGAAEALRTALDGVLAAHAAVAGGHACSAATTAGVAALRTRAAEEALYPLTPLCDTAAGASPTPALRSVLPRLFALLDTDGDGTLGPADLALFHRLAHYSNNSSSSGSAHHSVTAEGFARLVAQMLRRLRHAALWRLLRRAGYTADLTLAPVPSTSPSTDGVQYDLTDAAVAFLHGVHAACVAQHSREACAARIDALLAGRVPALADALAAAPWPLNSDDLVGAVRALCRSAPQDAVEALWLLGYGFADDAPDAGVRCCCCDLRASPSAASIVPAASPAVDTAWLRLWTRVRGWTRSTRFWVGLATAVASFTLGSAASGLLRPAPLFLQQRQHQNQHQQQQQGHRARPLLSLLHERTPQPQPWFARVRQFFS